MSHGHMSALAQQMRLGEHGFLCARSGLARLCNVYVPIVDGKRWLVMHSQRGCDFHQRKRFAALFPANKHASIGVALLPPLVRSLALFCSRFFPVLCAWTHAASSAMAIGVRSFYIFYAHYEPRTQPSGTQNIGVFEYRYIGVFAWINEIHGYCHECIRLWLDSPEQISICEIKMK